MHTQIKTSWGEAAEALSTDVPHAQAALRSQNLSKGIIDALCDKFDGVAQAISALKYLHCDRAANSLQHKGYQ